MLVHSNHALQNTYFLVKNKPQPDNKNILVEVHRIGTIKHGKNSESDELASHDVDKLHKHYRRALKM